MIIHYLVEYVFLKKNSYVKKYKVTLIMEEFDNSLHQGRRVEIVKI